MSQTQLRARAHACVEYADQVEKLSLDAPNLADDNDLHGVAVAAKFITPLDPVIETIDGNRLPAVPVQEAHRINILKDKSEGRPSRDHTPPHGLSRFQRPETPTSEVNGDDILEADKESQSNRLDEALPPAHTHPLFPPLPLYGPPSLLRNLQCYFFRVTSFFLSTGFLAVIVLGSIFTSITSLLQYIWWWMTFRDPDSRRPHYEEEQRRAKIREEQDAEWRESTQREDADRPNRKRPRASSSVDEYEPLEGGPDKLVCDVQYYARRVGLDMEEFKVQTEDGFIISLWHVYNPKEYTPAPGQRRRATSPQIFTDENDHVYHNVQQQYRDGSRRYPVLLIHGLLQSAGAYCANDDESLAFFLCKSGYDVWLGNNRCGFTPEHSLLKYHDPRMWAWNIRQMGVMDLPALISRVLRETGFEKLGLVCHSQGTTETFVALAKEQRPDLGDKISVFCALAPAVYAGPLIGKMYFKFMRVISPAMFRIFFGIHSFIPLMMTMHRTLPGKIYGAMGYRVFSFLFNWTDDRWDLGLRNRLFQFSPVYVSSESMRWWLGRECFAKHRCILATREEWQKEEVEDEAEEEKREDAMSHDSERGQRAWYDEHVPPFALWVGGRDELVDGRRLLRRFERGREPHVKLVHSKIIEEYEHLDVLWAIDAMEQVGKEVRHILCQTMPESARTICREIKGVEDALEDGSGIGVQER
ncbi:hypothetical protein PV10_03289 [Exophiala mesophila]|uniref:Partial AB-hydrolase lipase domain-containing protein n=1 Tax=Exophiala mesophila TaxID=212818 RepID=A0A0D1ZNW3_EXOME|nr:uncharacterized protein PV10_03289 [Exophiala mesophila]KIV95664.1 hypothetical protein PV10_03289 [Exophiala mesophila]